MPKHTAYICAGSNIGDKRRNCRKAIEVLTASGDCVLKDTSRYYRTEPIGFKDQDWFVNVMFKIETVLEPLQLLKKLKAIEREFGRVRDTVRFGPRILDLDVIFYDDLITRASGLEIPHPRMHKRRFVLKPICDIDSTVVHPVFKKTVRQLLELLGDDEQTVVEHQCDY